MAKLTPEDVIKRRLTESYDPSHYAFVYNQMRYSFGEKWSEGFAGVPGLTGGGTFPDFPALNFRRSEIGISRRIWNGQFIGLSKIAANLPEPEFPQVDKWTGEARKQFYLARMGMMDVFNVSGMEEREKAIADGDGLGIGVLQWVLEEDRKGNQYVCPQYVSCLHFLWDRHASSVARSEYVAVVRYASPEDAEDLFGSKFAKAYTRTLMDINGGQPYQAVRWFEYFDIRGGKVPTTAIIGGELTNKPHHVEENDLEINPFSIYTHWQPPGMARPVGRIALQMPTQEALNRVERNLMITLKNAGFDIVDTQQLDEQDLRRLNSGDPNVKVKLTSPKQGVSPFVRVPGEEVAQTTMALYNVLMEQMTAESGITNFDTGNLSQEKRTLGENQLADQRGAVQIGWSEKRVAEFDQAGVRVFAHLAKKFDRSPVMVDVFGANVEINAPGLPQSSAAALFDEPSKVLVGVDAIRATDAESEKMRRMMLLERLTPYAQAGAIPIEWLAREIIKAAGEDPDEVRSYMPQQQQGLPGQPGEMAGQPAAII